MALIHDKIRLAHAFGRQVQEALTTREVREACDRNKSQESPNVCHTHDFCDANMLMAEAFTETLGRDPDVADLADAELWNDAWEIAKAADFFA